MSRALFLLALVGMAAAWPELAPNCGLVGNWSDEAMRVGVIVRNITRGIIPNLFRVMHVTHGTCFAGTITSKDHRTMFLYASNCRNKHQKLYMVLACYGNELWGMDVPLGDNPVPATRVYTLTKVPPTPATPKSPKT